MGRPKGSGKPKEPLTYMQKLAKKIGTDGEEMIAELEAADVETLNKRIAQASQAISDAKSELDANEEYTAAKADCKLLSSGFSEAKKRQNAIIAASVQLRKDKGAT